MNGGVDIEKWNKVVTLIDRAKAHQEGAITCRLLGQHDFTGDGLYVPCLRCGISYIKYLRQSKGGFPYE